jgi:MFS transporter, DHA2 family, multidrug resistance protein
MTAAQNHATNLHAGRREWMGVAVLALAAVVVVMDLTVLFLAVPKMTADLHPSSTQLLWITDIYGFLIAGLLIAMGALGDRIGRRRVLLTGAAGFGAASLLSAFAVSPEMLIASRALQGIAGATLVPSAMALVFSMFQDETQRTKAVGVMMSSFAAGAALGPVVGGVLLSTFWWGSVFVLNVPVMALLLVLGPRILPEFRNPDAAPIDVASVVLSIAATLTAIYGVKQIARDGVDAVPVLAVVVGLALGAVFLRRQLRVANPLIDFELFRSQVFSTALSANIVAAFAMYGIFLFTSQYLQLGLDLTPLQAGLAGVPAIVALMMVANVVPVLTARARPGYVFAGGLAVTASGFLVLTQLGAHGGVGLVIAATIVMHVGIAPPMVLGTQLIVGSAPPERAGVASGMAETANELGGALGIALLGSLGTAIYRYAVAGQVPSGTAAAVRDTFAGAVDAAHSLPAGVLAAANDAFLNGLEAVAATGAVLVGVVAAVAVVTLRHVGRPDTGESSPEPAASPRRSSPRPPSPGAASARSAPA